MNIIKGFALTLGAAMILAVTAACSDDSQPQTPDVPDVSTAPAVQTSPPGEQSISSEGEQSVAPSSYALWTVRHANVEELIARSQVIVVGTLAEEFEERMIAGYGPDGQPSVDPEGALAYTDYQLNIEEVIRGDDTVSAGTKSVVFRMFGHINAQDVAPTSVVFKLPDPGDHLLFVMGKNPDGTYGSGPEGLFDLESEVAVYEDGMLFPSGGTTAELLEQIKALLSE